MTSQKSTRRTSWRGLVLAVAVGASSVVLLRTGVVGASFSASDVLGVNQLTSARLEVSEGANSVPVDVTDMAPGDTANGSLEITNTGTLPLVYALAVSVDSSGLASNLRFSLWSASDCDEPDMGSPIVDDIALQSADESVIIGDPAPGRQNGDRQIAVGDSDTLCYSVSLPIDATNSAQGEAGTQVFTVYAEHDIATVEPA